MNRLLHILATLITLFSISANLQATNYYTLTSGNYADAVSVWSLDGISACGCNPGTTISGPDSIFIRHDLDMTSITLQSGGAMVISSGVNVAGTGSMAVSSGTAINNGNLTIASIVNSFGSVTSNGILEVNASNFYNIGGTVDISGYASVASSYRNLSSGTLILRTNSTMMVGTFFFNIGVTALEAGSCLNVAADYSNPEIGAVLGEGHVSADFNINNDGFWDADVSWCAGVTGNNLPTPPNCLTCGPLPVTLASFEAIYRKENRVVDLQWTTASEVNNAYFILERSTDGKIYQAMEMVPSQVSTGISGSYEITDAQPADGINYYRLRQVDKDGQEQVLETTSIFVSDALSSDAAFYPNPSNGPVNFTVSLEREEELNVLVTDLQGSVVFELILPASNYHQGMVDLSPFPAGTYLVRVSSLNFRTTKKVVRF